jgi:aspartyl-tRNA(Asn)/glutamyl-tRNA(Gln) amidotransferase subunit C
MARMGPFGVFVVIWSSFLFRCRPLMSIDHATVRRIARLARLSVDDAHLENLANELNGVLRLADALAKADVEGVEPLAHPHEQALAMRQDAVTEPDRADALLALAPESRGGMYLVPKVIE